MAGFKPLSLADAATLRLIARRTWRFFETFVTAEDNMLAPDNFQEDPKPVLAHRTSPTNLGLYLLSAIAAHDFGWIGTHETVERMEATLATMSRLELFRGHFYNWYETRDLRPLEPKYVSSVDSGNLAGHLIAFANACREVIGAPDSRIRDGGRVSRTRSRSRASHLPALGGDFRTHTVTAKQLDEALDALGGHARRRIRGLRRRWPNSWRNSGLHAGSVVDIAQTLTTERGDGAGAELLAWAEAIRASIDSHRREVELLMPWASLITARRGDRAGGAKAAGVSPDCALGAVFDSIPTLGDLPDRCEAAIGILARRKAALAADGGKDRSRLARLLPARARESTRSPTHSRAPRRRPAHWSAG